MFGSIRPLVCLSFCFCIVEWLLVCFCIVEWLLLGLGLPSASKAPRYIWNTVSVCLSVIRPPDSGASVVSSMHKICFGLELNAFG